MASLFSNSTNSDHEKTNRSDDRIITFQLIDDKAPLSSIGLADPRLFKGGNRLHAQRDDGGLWIVRYEKGSVPPALQQHWTHFSRLLEDVTHYFKSRNMSINRVADTHAAKQQLTSTE